MINQPKGNEMTDGLGYTEAQWERMWNSETATSTVHRESDDDYNYCEGCDSAVVYSDPSDKYGKCGCDV